MTRTLERAAPSRRPRRGARRFWGAALLLAGLAALGYSQRARIAPWLAYLKPAGEESEPMSWGALRRETLSMSLQAEGQLRAAKNVAVFFPADGNIAWLVAAGATVKTGDVVASLEKGPIETDLRKAKGELETAVQVQVVAEQSLPITEATNQAEIANAATKLKDAQLALKLYSTVDAPKKLSDFESSLADLRSKMHENRKKKSDAQGKIDELIGGSDEERRPLEKELSIITQSLKSQSEALRSLEEQRKMFRAYNYPQDLDAKHQALINAQLGVKKAEISARASLLQKQAEVKKARGEVERLEREIKRLETLLEAADVKAPCAGFVIYGDPRNSWEASEIKVGNRWYKGRALITIPDLSAYEVDLDFTESARAKLKVGHKARLSVAAIPGREFLSQINKIAAMSHRQNRWDESSPSLFSATFRLEELDPRMVPGMGVRAEVLLGEIPDVLLVPIEGVFNEEGFTCVYLKSSDGPPRQMWVTCGQSSDHQVVILRGLPERGEVCLSRPAIFTPTPRPSKPATMPGAAAPSTSPTAPAESSSSEDDS